MTCSRDINDLLGLDSTVLFVIEFVLYEPSAPVSFPGCGGWFGVSPPAVNEGHLVCVELVNNACPL